MEPTVFFALFVKLILRVVLAETQFDMVLVSIVLTKAYWNQGLGEGEGDGGEGGRERERGEREGVHPLGSSLSSGERVKERGERGGEAIGAIIVFEREGEAARSSSLENREIERKERG